MKTPKYRNRKTVVGGVTFDSAKEARRWSELCLLEKAGDIQNLQRQVRFPFTINGKLICTLVADFTYDRDGVKVVEDTKSPATRKLPVFRIKSKLLKSLYGIEVVES